MTEHPLHDLVADALSWHEAAYERGWLGRRRAMSRADAVLAAIALDHVVVPRRVVERMLIEYAVERKKAGGRRQEMEALKRFYRRSAGWVSRYEEAHGE